MKNGFYYMITASLFKSKYRGGDNVSGEIRGLDKRFLVNLLAGKEWMVGKLKQNVLSVNGRLYFFKEEDAIHLWIKKKSQEEKDIVFDETQAYT